MRTRIITFYPYISHLVIYALLNIVSSNYQEKLHNPYNSFSRRSIYVTNVSRARNTTVHRTELDSKTPALRKNVGKRHCKALQTWFVRGCIGFVWRQHESPLYRLDIRRKIQRGGRARNHSRRAESKASGCSSIANALHFRSRRGARTVGVGQGIRVFERGHFVLASADDRARGLKSRIFVHVCQRYHRRHSRRP